jgi:selenocysteine lyase/cysteine desulfurase
MSIDISQEFSLRKNIIHLNHAGVSPWPVRAARAVERFAEENMAQGSLDYQKWSERETGLRRQAQKLLNAPAADSIALLKNTSEALSLVAYGLDWKNGDNIVSSNQEFPSNRIVWESLSQRGVEFREADLSSTPDPEDALFSLVNARTKMITISSIQFGSGLRMDLFRIGEFCKNRDILFCVDAIQSLGAVKFNVQEIQADFVMADGHKWMLGPEGLAVFYCKPDVMDRLSLTQYGWHMVEEAGNFDRRDWRMADSARRFECGSPNMIGIHALSASLSLLLETGMEYVEKEILRRSEYLFGGIQTLRGAELITPKKTGRYAGIVTFRPGTIDPASLYSNLTRENILCALRGGGIRFSPHFYTPYEHLDHAIELMKHIVEE